MEHGLSILLLAVQDAASSAPAPWWLRWGLLVAGALALAALMVLVQTRNRAPYGAVWALVILLMPVLGPLTYLILEMVRHRRQGYRASRGSAERLAAEEPDDDGPTPGPGWGADR